MEQPGRNTRYQTLHLLLADDNPLFLESALRFLALHTWLRVIGTATTGRQTLDLIHHLHPDLVLLDLQMPDLNGLEVGRLIKRQPDAPRVILVTFYDTPEHRRVVQAEKLDGFVSKSEFSTTLLPLICTLYNRPLPQ